MKQAAHAITGPATRGQPPAPDTNGNLQFSLTENQIRKFIQYHDSFPLYKNAL